MRYLALACDYDGTAAHDGHLEAATAAALRELRASGRKSILVTGRQLDDLHAVCPVVDAIFDAVVAENGGLLYLPDTKESRPLAEAAPVAFVDALQRAGVGPISVGQVIVATWRPHERVVQDTIRKLGLELQVVFNKGAVMVLPSGVNKATGLAAALAHLGLSPHNAVAVGDAENDHALLASCECGVAVANALPSVKERADMVTNSDHGAGVAELCGRLLATDLAELAPALARHDVPIGHDVTDGQEVLLPVFGASLLVAGTSGGGKSTAVTGIIEGLAERGYQHVVIDPEGDYGAYEHAIALGDVHHAPALEEVLKVLAKPDVNVAINLLSMPLEDRPSFFGSLLPRLQEMRARTGRPHWLIVDEAHHLVPASRDSGVPPAFWKDLTGVVLVTVHPEHVASSVLARIETAMVIGQTPADTLREFAMAGGMASPGLGDQWAPLAPGEAIVWSRSSAAPARRVRTAVPRTERHRHVRKYAEGELDADKSFYFRGPEGRLNLRAQNLRMFLQIADGVDAATWLHHLHAGDYSRWARRVIKDDELAEALTAAEHLRGRDDRDGALSRAAVRQAIEQRYTAPD